MRDPEIKVYDYTLDELEVDFKFEDGGLTVRPYQHTFKPSDPPNDLKTPDGVIHLRGYSDPYLYSGTHLFESLIERAGANGVLYLKPLYIPWSRVISVKIVKRTLVPIRFEWKNCDECRHGRCLRAQAQ